MKEVLEERLFPVKKLALLDDDEALGLLTEFQGEPALVASIEADTFRENDLVFCSGPAGTDVTRPLL